MIQRKSYLGITALSALLTLTAITTGGRADDATLLPNAIQYFMDANGKPLANGKVFMYTPSTTTPKTTWTTADKAVAQPQPFIPLGIAGKPASPIYGDGSYRQKVVDQFNNTIWDFNTASTGSGGGGGGTPTVGDGNIVGTILPWSGLLPPPNYVFAFGQTIIRADFPLFVSTTTIATNVICTSGLNVLSGITDTQNIPLGAPVEASCIPPGTTVSAKATSSVTISANASVSTATGATFFPWGNGNGSSTINVPDLRGRALVGRNNMGGTASSTLSTLFYITSPNAMGAFGGAQSETLIRDNLPNISLATTITDPQHLHSLSGFGTVSVLNGSGASQGNLVTSSGGTPFSINTQNAATGITASTVTGGSNAPFTLVQPSTTINWIIKVLPDTSTTVASGVASIGGMTGVIACGTGLTCASNTISINFPADAITIGSTAVGGGSSNGVLFNNSAVLGAVNGNLGFLATNGSGLPAITNNVPVLTQVPTGQFAQDFGARVNRMTDRLFVGDGAYQNSGSGDPALQGDWLTTYQYPYEAPMTLSTLSVLADTNHYPALFGARNLGGGNAIALQSYALSNGNTSGSNAWGFYSETYRANATVGTAYNVETAVVNQGNVVHNTPYAGLSGSTIGHQLDCGNGGPDAQWHAQRCSTAILVVQNTDGVSDARWNNGVVFQNNSIAPDPTTSTPTAVALPIGYGFQWYTDATTVGTRIYSSVTGGAAFQTMEFSDTGLSYRDAANVQRFGVTATGHTTSTLLDNDAGAALGPSEVLLRSSASPAVSDFLGERRFDGLNSIGGQLTYASISAQITNATAGSERGNLYLQTPNGGAAILNQGLQIGAPTGGDCGLGCLNATDVRINNVSLVAGITALTGDVTATGPGTVAATLATVNANTGSWGSATQVPQFTVNGKGLITAAANVTITPAIGSITGLGTGVATALGINIGSAGAFTTFNGAHGTPSSITLTNATGLPISTGLTGAGTGVLTALGVNVGTAGSFVVNGGALGTPSSGVGTNLTGTASGLTAGNVTTNANLTGDVTSVGNATTLTNAPVIAKVLTGFTSGAGTVSSADSILSAFQKINGNDALKAPIASPTFTGTVTIPSGAVLGTPTSINLSNAASLPTTALTGALQAGQFPALTGDVTTSAGALATTLATTQSAAHTWSAVNTFSSATAGTAGGTTGALVVSAGDVYVSGKVWVNGGGAGATGVVLDGANQKIQLGSIDTITRSGIGTLAISTNGGNINIVPASAITAITGSLTVSALGNVATTSAVCYNTATGVISYDGTLGTCTVSDERLKDIEGPIVGALDSLMKIHGIYYTWKDQALGTGRQIGVGAQTVEKVFPELVQTGSDGTKAVDYQRLVAPIIEAMRELKADNANLRSRISVLEARK